MTNDIALPDELRRTHPDYVVYIPGGAEQRLPDSANEHFLVFRRGDGTLAAVWTQSGFEGQANQHIVFAESDAHGKAWSRPRLLAGNDADPQTGKGMCSWGYPMVSRSGRIYVLYSKHTGVNDVFTHTTGVLTGIHSDDQGRTWSAEAEVRVPRTRYDHPIPPSRRTASPGRSRSVSATAATSPASPAGSARITGNPSTATGSMCRRWWTSSGSKTWTTTPPSPTWTSRS